MNDKESVVNVVNVRYGKSFVILVTYQKEKELLSVLDAKRRAIALIRASEIAVTEVRIIKSLNPKFDPRPKGFSKKVRMTKDDEMSLGLLKLMRDSRPKLPDNIKPIFGFETLLPLVNYVIGKSQLCFTIAEIQDHAQSLLEAAEACETDKFFDYFGDLADLDRETVSILLSEFAKFRRKNRLENLFNIN